MPNAVRRMRCFRPLKTRFEAQRNGGGKRVALEGFKSERKKEGAECSFHRKVETERREFFLTRGEGAERSEADEVETSEI